MERTLCCACAIDDTVVLADDDIDDVIIKSELLWCSLWCLSFCLQQWRPLQTVSRTSCRLKRVCFLKAVNLAE